MIKKAIIFLNGDKSNILRVKNIIDKKTLLIGCDGGTKHILSLGAVPHVVIGDLDSLPAKLKKELKNYPVEFVKFSTRKDNTDSELAILFAIEKKYNHITIVGTLGSRTDHFIGNILMFSKPIFSTVHLKIIEGDQDLYVVRKQIHIQGKSGETLSLIPILSDAEGVVTKGLEYVLEDSVLPIGTTRGISNILTSPNVEISLKKGVLLVIHKRLMD